MTTQQDIVAGRLAVVDLLFAWPPNGGADVDLYCVLRGLAKQGIPVQLFVLQFDNTPGRGQVDPAAMPFPVEVVRVPDTVDGHEAVTRALRDAVDDWSPDMVWLSHGYTLKPRVALALAHYPLIGRYYAHEMLCARNALRYRDNAPCPYDFFSNPEVCRPCAFDAVQDEIRRGQHQAWTQDYLIAKAYTKEYHAAARQALEVMTHIVVSNEELKQELGVFQDKTIVIPGGIDTDIPFCATEPDRPVKTIFVSGRMDDPAKGLQVVLGASALLQQKRSDFRVVATHFDQRLSEGNFVATGWLSHEEALEQMANADICVVPSLWREPFGLVAVEAMMAGKPVCASDTGGLRDIVVQGETGYLFPPGDSAALAGFLEALLDNPELRLSLGNTGRDSALSRFTWEQIIESHYLPLLEQIMEEKDVKKGTQAHE